MKTTRMSLALAAAMTLSGVSVSSLLAEDAPARNHDQTVMQRDVHNNNRDENVPALRLPNGTKPVDNVKTEDMRDIVAQVTEVAMTKGSFSDIVERFVDQDRNRLGETKLSDNDKEMFDGRVAQLQKAFKAKYNQDFDINDVNKVFANTTAVEGEITDSDAVAAVWPVAVNPGAPDAQTAGNRVPSDPDVRKSQGNIDNGREIGILRYAGTAGLPTLDISMVDEAGGWKIDLNNSRTTQQVYKDLMTHLTYLGEHTDQWPGDINEAYRLFAHHVLMGINGVDLPTPQKG